MSHPPIREWPSREQWERGPELRRDSTDGPPTAVTLHHLRVYEEQVIRNMVFDSGSEIVMYLTPEREIRWVNRAACTTAGKGTELLKGKPCREVWGEEGCPAQRCPVKEALEKKEPVMLLRTDGRGRRWIMHGIPVFREDGRLTGALEIVEKAGTPEIGEEIPDGYREVLSRLISSRLREKIRANTKLLHLHQMLEDEIEQRLNLEWKYRMLTEQMLTLKEAKSRFLTNMGNEMRRPLSAMLGYLDLMNESQIGFWTRWRQERECSSEEMPEEMAANFKYQTLLRNHTRELLSTLDGLIDISRFETGRRKVERFVCATVLHIKQVLDLVQETAEAKKILMRFEPVTSVPETIRTDPGQLRRVLFHLLNRMIGATRAGEVRLLLSTHAEGNQAQQLKFEIFSRGEVDEDLLDKETESIADQLTENAGPNTAELLLGMVDCRKIVQDLGGTLRRENDLEKGLGFSFTIHTGSLQEVARIEPEEIPPLLERLEARRAESEERPLLCGNVLLATDDGDQHQVVGAYLRRAGLKVRTVSHGKEALDQIRRQQEKEYPFHLVLLDLHMPVMDGYQTLQAIRKIGFDLPVIAMTPDPATDSKEKCLASGFRGWLRKPFSFQDLHDCLSRVLASRGST